MTPEVSPAIRATKGISAAKQTLLDEERCLLQQVATIREVIAAMDAAERKQSISLPAIKPDEFKGLRPADALAIYLRGRRGNKIPLSTAVADLLEGGCDPGAARGRQNDPVALVTHNLKIGIPNLRRFVDFSPKQHSAKGKPVIPRETPNDEILIWLAESADQLVRRKRPKTMRA